MKDFEVKFQDIKIEKTLLTRKVRFLASDFISNTWIIKRNNTIDDPSKNKINWEWNGEEQVFSGRSNCWRNYARELSAQYVESNLYNCESPGTFVLMIREFRSMCQFFDLNQNVENPSCVTREDVAAYESHIKNLNLTKNTVMIKLSLLSISYELRDKAGYGLTFNPYVKSNSLSKKSKLLARIPGKSTKTIKPKLLFKMLSDSLEYIESNEDWLEYLNVYLDIINTSSSKQSRKFEELTQRKASELIKKINILYGASLVVFWSLIPPRVHELSYFLSSDVDLINENSPFIPGRLTKTAGAEGGVETKRPMIPELVKAIKIIQKITQPVRDKFGDIDILFLKNPLNLRHSRTNDPYIRHSNVYRLLKGVANHFNWNVKPLPHMFRRAYALLYVWRFEIGDVDTLRRMLFHNDTAYTQAYINEDDIRDFLPEAEQMLSHDVLEKALFGGKSFYGAFGKRLQKWKRRIQSVSILISPERAERVVNKFLEDTGLVIRSFYHGYCIQSLIRAKRSKCSTDGKNPDYVNRRDSHCTHCFNFMTHEGRAFHYENQKRAHTVVFESTNSPVLKKAAKEGMANADLVLKRLLNEK